MKMNRYVVAAPYATPTELYRLEFKDWKKLDRSLRAWPVYFNDDKKLEVWPLPIDGCRVYKLVEVDL